MKRTGAYKFTSKKQSLKGIMSAVMSVLSLICFFVAGSISFGERGETDLRLGAAGFIGTVFALAGFVLAIMSLNEKDIYRLFPGLGFALSLIACFLWGMIFIIGLGIR